ncbi:glycoside hydrolase family 17 protein [Derxia lacustris]|uniref:glycoside hydrolase family 17 protein n=1 Tax=Derxia lacustris TaxID=764842 RepID=UPI00111C04E0|nr:beta-1,6-glucan synthase [Derxia lacustris]
MTPLRLRAFLLLHLLAIAALAVLVWQSNRLVDVPPFARAPGEKFQCTSYSPYHKPGQTPFNAGFVVPPEQIDEDLAHLSEMFGCVRTYSVDQGLDRVPELARKHGMKVLLGIWIGQDDAKNRVELDRAIAVANANADVVSAIIVGNEVLLRRDQPEFRLKGYLDYVRERTKLPLTYADVWEFWLKHPAMAPAVDFITVHILPFWEDIPVPIETAIPHLDATMAKVEAAFPGRELMIGEVGWPSEGRRREGSVPSLVNQASFVRALAAHVKEKGWRYNLIEAIDQPWKRLSEGTAGGYWGFYTVELERKFGFDGPVANRRDAPQVGLAALIGLAIGAGLALGGLGAARKLGATAAAAAPSAPAVAAAGGLLGLFAGAVLWLQHGHALLAYRNPAEWLSLGAITVLSLLLALLAAQALGRAAGGADDPSPAAAAEAQPGIAGAAQLAAQRSATAPAAPAPLPVTGAVEDMRATTPLQMIARLRALILFGAAVGALLLAVDARYRDFPWQLYAIGALELGLALPLALGARWPAASRAEIGLGLLIALGAVVRWAVEPTNPDGVGWMLLGLVLGLGGLGGPAQARAWLTGASGPRSTATPPSTAPTADRS